MGEALLDEFWWAKFRPLQDSKWLRETKGCALAPLVITFSRIRCQIRTWAGSWAARSFAILCTSNHSDVSHLVFITERYIGTDPMVRFELPSFLLTFVDLLNSNSAHPACHVYQSWQTSIVILRQFWMVLHRLNLLQVLWTWTLMTMKSFVLDIHLQMSKRTNWLVRHG